MLRLRICIVTAVAIVTTLLFYAPPATAAMSDAYAGRYYLAQVCPTNAAWENVERKLFRGKRYFYAKQMKGKRLRQVRRALTRLVRVDYNAGRRLLNAPDAWPSAEITNATNAVARAAIRESNIIANLRSRKKQRFVNYWVNFVQDDTRFSDTSRTARALLDLPPNGEGC